MPPTKVAIVTGSNKGIGFAIVKGLCKKFKGTVYLTARNDGRGLAAVKALQEEGLSPNFHQLDIDDIESIRRFADYIQSTYGGIDLLVNNAGIAFKAKAKEPVPVQAEKTVATNYFGTLNVCNALFPLLRENARVINVSSSSGHLSRIPGETLRAQISNASLAVSELSALMNQYVRDCREGENVNKGWGTNSYVVSKVGISALTRIQQAHFDKTQPEKNITVNCVHPGYVATDMSSHAGTLTVEEGAKAPLYLSLEQHGLKGQYVWFDNSVVDWMADSYPNKA